MLRRLEIHAFASSVPVTDEGALIMLREKNGDRVIPLQMSMRRAVTLMARDKMPLPAQLPVSVGDISVMMLQQFGINITYVELTAVKEGNFTCRVVCHRGEEEHIIEHCQAADGLIISVISRCPLVIEEELLELQYMHKIGDGAYAMNINILSRRLLEQALEHAVANENYEVASQLRDELQRRTNEAADDSQPMELQQDGSEQ
ncbi:MAG: bifunctional nuclease family protein [Bacteroidaceae bacterium]|nr:bifunctional nuclease family protein [Bacteroidaceae bacterium]